MPRKPVDLKGRSFGRLSVLGRESFEYDKHGVRWNCRCECGNSIVAYAHHLLQKRTQSCGCLKRDNGQTMKNGLTHGMYGSPEYVTWDAMKTRCTNPNHVAFHRYGGRGITIDPRWLHSFENFYADMGPRPGPEYSIERIDNNGNYEPGNCKWATAIEQQQNTCRSRR